ncbi:hypothetical protein GGS21DRAFT_433682 [Xylaria nigripes]|nr:hypothetical protein GGS21DRAFT_433682 [Xylaria nigripes]
MPELSAPPYLPLKQVAFDGDDDEVMQLGEKENGFRCSVHASKGKHSKLRTIRRAYMVVIHLLVICLILKIWNNSTRLGREISLKGESWSPAREFIEYSIQSEHSTEHDKHSKYSGTPNHDQDTAWDDLIRPMFFNASLEELRRGGERLENLAAVRGGGFAATIGAYHELHCLRQLRFYLFRDRYYPNLTAAQDIYLRGHLDHCIETLRLTIMCYGNPALVSFAWGGESAQKPLTQSNSRSVCAKWESIDAWARSRTPENYALAERH